MTAALHSTTGLVTVAQHVPRAGQVAWWRLSGTTDRAALATAWAATTLKADLLPPGGGPVTALARALNELRSGRTLVRPLASGEGRALVLESAKGTDLEYAVSLRAKLDAVGRPVFDPPDHPQVPVVLGAVDKYLHQLTTGDVGSWLVRMVEHCDGVRLRDTGGVYFVPEHGLETWRQVVAAVHAASAHRINGVPAMRADDAVASILDAVRAEAEVEAADLEAQMADPKFTAKKAANRIRVAEALQAKLARYEVLLEQRAADLHARLRELQSKLTAASLIDSELEDA